MAALSSAYAADLTNVALGKPITPITNTILGEPVWVTDGGNETEAWFSYQGGSYNTNSFTIDLGASFRVASVDLFVSQVVGYQLHSSDNGSYWTLRNEDNFDDYYYGAIGPLPGGYSAGRPSVANGMPDVNWKY